MPICLECNTFYKLLNSHITRTHKITTNEYKLRYGENTPFTENSVRELQRKNGYSPWSIKDAIDRGESKSDAENRIKTQKLKTFGKHTSVRCVDYWIKNGKTPEEAKTEIKLVQSRGKDYYVSKYGDSGLEKYEEHYTKSGKSNSKNYMLSCGKSLEDVRLIRDNISIESIMIKSGVNLEKAIQIRTNRLANHKSSRTLKYWVSLGYDLKQAKELLANAQSRSLQYFIKKYGVIFGTEKYNTWVYDATKYSVGKTSSKESIEYFKILIDYCIENKINHETEKYFCINSKSYYADLVLDDYKLIFEYDGEAWHADPRINDLNWVSAKKNKTYQESLNYDIKKTKALESIGYMIIRIHSKYKDEYNLIDITKDRINGK